METCAISNGGAVAVDCYPGTRDIGATVFIEAAVRNDGYVDLPAGLYAFFWLPEVGVGGYWESSAPLAPGGSDTARVAVVVPGEWSGMSLDVQCSLYESKAARESHPELPMAAEECTDLLVVNPGAPSAEIVSMGVF